VRRALLVVTAVLLPGAAVAQEPPRQPLQELFLTETVYPQQKGEVQLTLGALVDRSRSDSASLTPFAVEYGLTDRWQIEAGWDGYTQFRAAPFKHMRTARFSIGTKYSVMNIAHSRVHAAFGIEAEFPNAAAFADDEGEEGMEMEPFAAFAADIGRRLSVFGSLGASVEPRQVADIATRGRRPDDRGVIGFGALLAFRHATLVAEYTNRSDELPWRLDGAPMVTPSIVIRGEPDWEIAVGTVIGLRQQQHQPGLAVHIVKEF
jgi:hypothetical protein